MITERQGEQWRDKPMTMENAKDITGPASPPSAPPPGSEPDSLEERKYCDRCKRMVTVLDWSACGHPDCYAFFGVLPSRPPNKEVSERRAADTRIETKREPAVR